MSSAEEKARSYYRITRAVCVVVRMVAVLTVVIGVYVLATERNWFVLALGAWAAIAVELLAHSNRRNGDDGP